MESNPLFSIIVPVYNAAKFVEETICNLLKQDVSKEILFINDGSSDNSLEILLQYANVYDCIRIIDKKNGGVSSARNVGLDEALGKYIIFVDSDDFIEDNLLQRCELIFETQQPDSIFFSYKYCYPGSSRKDVCHYYKPTGLYSTSDWLDDFYTLWYYHILHCIGTKIYRKSIIEQYHIRFNEKISYLEDISLATEYLGHLSNLYYINEPLYHYRIVNENSLITKFRPNYYESVAYLCQKQKLAFENIYQSQGNVQSLYKLYADSLEQCLYNIFAYNKEHSEEAIHSLVTISQLSYINLCIKESTTFNKKIKLLILRKMSITYSIKILHYMYMLDISFQKCKYHIKNILKSWILHR